MASFVQLIGIGLNNIKQVELNERNVTILGVAVLLVAALCFYRLERSSPCRLSYNIYLEMVCSVGTVVSILLEQIWRTEK